MDDAGAAMRAAGTGQQKRPLLPRNNSAFPLVRTLKVKQADFQKIYISSVHLTCCQLTLFKHLEKCFGKMFYNQQDAENTFRFVNPKA